MSSLTRRREFKVVRGTLQSKKGNHARQFEEAEFMVIGNEGCMNDGVHLRTGK